MIVVYTTLKSQNYNVLGNAVPFGGCNCFRLTEASNGQGGAAYQNQTINLNNSFDFTFELFFGCRDDGADGIVFVLTDNITGIGQSGGGLGYGGLQGNSFAVEFDTYQNSQDPGQDHIAFASGGSVNHNVAGPVSALSNGGNVEDCAPHTVRIVWDVNTNTLSVFFDGVLRLSQVFPNFVNTYFAGNPIINWGFSASTGGENNEQRFCITSNSNWVAGVNYQSCNTTMQFTDISTSNIGSVASWAWNFGDGNTSNIQNPMHTYASTGTYNVSLTITDNTGCTNTYARPVTINPPIVLTPTIVSPPCNGGTNGSLTMNATGGFGVGAGYGGYQFSFNGSPLNLSNTLVGAAAGNYTVSVTDGVCSQTGTYTITQPTPLTATTSKVDANCNLNNGSVSISISGGTPPYQNISWAGIPGATRTGLGAGTYIADFQDANGCSALLQYRETVNNLPCGLNSNLTSTNVSCFGGNNGSATLTITGGAAGGNVVWNPGGLTGFSVNGLAAGTYTYNYTDNNPGNAFLGTVTISQPPVAMAASLSVINQSCDGVNDGSAVASVTAGGTPNYTYAWSVAGQGNTPIATNLPAGPISVTITDSRNCVAIASGNITGPPSFALSITAIDDSCNQSGTGSASSIVSGGNGGYLYSWNNGLPGRAIFGLNAGSYSLTVTDSRGCTISENTTVNEPPVLSLTLNSTDVTCNGFTDGTITATASGGNGNYSFNWSPAAPNQNSIGSLAAGTYYLTVSDVNNCAQNDSVVITQPDSALLVATLASNVSCFGANDGAIQFAILGGTAPYTYLNNPVATNFTLNNLSPNTYAGQVEDANGCLADFSETITEPALLVVDTLTTPVTCFGASDATIDLTVSGGTTPYSFIWSDTSTQQNRTNLAPGNYSVTVTDDNNCSVNINISIALPALVPLPLTVQDATCFGGFGYAVANPSQGIAIYNFVWSFTSDNTDSVNVVVGNYSVTATASNGCIQETTFTINQPAPVPLVIDVTDALCFGELGIATANPSEGTAPFDFIWSSNTVNAATNNLPAGSYSVSSASSENCLQEGSFTIAEPTEIVVSESHTDLLCNNDSSGTINITANGGTGTLQYAWPQNISNTNTANNLNAGSYSVSVSDQNNCSVEIEIVLSEPDTLAITLQSENISCYGLSDANIEATVSGGTPNYQYTIDNGANFQPSNIFSNLPEGSYIIVVSDNNNCEISSTVNITMPDSLSVAFVIQNPTCFGFDDAYINTTVNGGTPSYTYNWSNGQTNNNLTNLSSGNYAVTIRDNNNCSITTSGDIVDPIQISINASPDSTEIKFGGEVAITTVLTNTNEQSGTYSWSPSEYLSCTDCPNPTSIPSEDMNYTVTFIDTNGCLASDAIFIETQFDKIFYAPNAFSPNGDGINDVFKIEAKGVKDFTFRVFNRWGEKVFESFDINIGWDGMYYNKILNPGVYIYDAQIIFLDDDVENLKGSITLIK